MAMTCISQSDFERAAEDHRHYYARTPERSRWNYYRHAIELINRKGFESAIELGAYRLPLIQHCHTIDHNPDLSPTFLFDASMVPWPIAPRVRYDIFVGLQVLEHLGHNQAAAFREIRRIAKSAVISLPFLWNLPENPPHHNISDELIAKWTDHIEPTERRVVAPDGSVQNEGMLVPFSRVLLRYEFSDRTSLPPTG